MKRRASTEGSVFQRQDGRWAASLDLGWENGKRRRKSFYGETQGGVVQKLRDAIKDREAGLPIPGERQTVGQFLKQWLESTVKPNRRPRTYESYEELIRVHLAPAFGNRPLKKLSVPELQDFLNAKLAAGLSPRTVQYLRAVLRVALNRAMRLGLVARNVATLVEVPGASKSEIEPLTQEQARAFLKAVKGTRLEALYTVAVAVGLRRGEALGLGWADIDFQKRELQVRSALQRTNGHLELAPTKTHRSTRNVLLPEVALSALRAHKRRQNLERAAAGSRWEDHGLVFTTLRGKPLEPRNVLTQFHAVLEGAGLPRKRFHDLRHSCATLLLAQGVPARTVMDLLGHEEIRTTLDIYGHVDLGMRQEAARKIDAALVGRKAKRQGKRGAARR